MFQDNLVQWLQNILKRTSFSPTSPQRKCPEMCKDIALTHSTREDKQKAKQVLTPVRASCATLLCAGVLSCVQLFVTLWTIAHQAPLSMEFSRQEYCTRTRNMDWK